MAHCSVDHRCWTIALWPSASKKSLHFRVSVVCPVIALISKKKVFTFGRVNFALISEKNVSASESPIFVNSPIDITEIRLFLNQAANFRRAVGPTAKSPMTHWLRNPDVEDQSESMFVHAIIRELYLENSSSN